MSREVNVWPMPVLLACVSTMGLASALLADGWADALSWITLTVPVLVIFWYSLKRSTD
jgi:hypothetical protein